MCLNKPVLSLVLVVVISKYFAVTTEEINEGNNNILKAVVSSLLETEAKFENKKGLRIAVGFGSCLDVMIPALKFFETINLDAPDLTRNYDTISSVDQFRQTFAYFFLRGASAGRFTTNAELFGYIFNATRTLNPPIKLGGNAPVMSRRLGKENVSVLLMADAYSALLSDDVNDLRGNIRVVTSKSEPEDTHLIFEYEKGDKWGSYEAPRANRFILYKTSGSPVSSNFDKYLDEFIRFKPDLLVVSGFRVLHQTVYEDGKSGLQHLRKFLKKVPRDIKVHVELSSFPKVETLRSVIKDAVFRADSLGMNEQELPNLKACLESELSGSSVDKTTSTLVSESHPSLASTLDNARHVVKLLSELQNRPLLGASEKSFATSYESGVGSSCRNSMEFLGVDCKCKLSGNEEISYGRFISRIHVHTLAFQAVITKLMPNSNVKIKQKQSKDTLGKCSSAESKSFNNKTEFTGNVFSNKSCQNIAWGGIRDGSECCRKLVHSGKEFFHLQTWSNVKTAAAKSALTANRHTCGNETIDLQNSMLFLQPNIPTQTSLTYDSPPLNFEPNDAVTCWQEPSRNGEEKSFLEICVAPVVICKKVKQTVGGGDNVSAAALVSQV